MKKLVWFFMVLGITMMTTAQQKEHLSSFAMTSLTLKLPKKFFVYGELQARGYEEFSQPDYYEIKGGVGYYITPDHQPFIGMGRYATYKNNSISKEEFRLWAQYQYNQYLGKLKLEHRVRLEQQFFYYAQTDTKATANRYRYRLHALLPLNNEKIKEKTFFINAFDEIFFGKDAPSNFVRNRIFAGAGYQFTKQIGLSMGYLWQREFANAGNKNIHFLFTGLTFTIDKSKSFTPKPIPVNVVD